MMDAVWLTLPPQPFKPCRIGGGVHDGVLNIPVPQVVLDQPCIGALVGQGEAARVAQHVRMRVHGQACALAIGADRQPGGLTAERASPLTDKERVRLWFHSRTLS